MGEDIEALTPEQKIELKSLHHARGSIQRQITNFNNIFDNQVAGEEGPDIIYLQAAFETLQSHWSRFDQIQIDIETLVNSEVEMEKGLELQNRYHLTVAKYRKIMHTRTAERDQSSDNDSAIQDRTVASLRKNNNSIHLPVLTVPTFDGSIEEWASFYNLFVSLIDKNPNLDPVQKLQYLRAAIKGKAAKVISALAATDKNYQTALELLRKKYECTRKVVLKHWDAIREIPCVQANKLESLDDLVDSTRQHLQALQNLEQPIDKWDIPIISLLLMKIPSDLATQWELTIGNTIPSYEDLLTFLEARANCSEFTASSKNSQGTQNKNTKNSRFSKQSKTHAFATSTQQTPNAKGCPICTQSHKIYGCPTFHNMTIEERNKAISNAMLCYNCLAWGHGTKDCQSKKHCQTCNKNNVHTPTVGISSFFADGNLTDDLLPTILLLVKNHSNRFTSCRAFLDTGSSANFITEEFVNNLQLHKKTCDIPIGTLNGTSTHAKYWVSVTFKSRLTSYQRTLQFLVVPQICPLSPQQQINRSSIAIPSNIKLADPEFDKPAPIHMLIASGPSAAIFSLGQIRLSEPQELDLYLLKTLFGWILMGSLSSHHTHEARCNLLDLQKDMSKFWEIEEGLSIRRFSPEEQECEKHFIKHVTRDASGRYVVALPFNAKRAHLGTSRTMALRRFLSLERRLDKNPQLRQQYHDVIDEYITLGHMTKVENETEEGFYLPHHAVIKATSHTTKVRVVFDGSAKSSTGLSLNDTLMTGPTIQDDLFSLILRFRLHNFVLTGDLEKMYRQVLVRKADRKYQRILWREKDGSISVYELNTVTFGLTPASFLAIRCIHQLADDEGYRYPKAAIALKQSLYVDDFLSGKVNVEKLIKLRDDIMALLALGGFNMRQCASNSLNVLQGLPATSVNLQLQENNDLTLKTLGVYWDSQRDSITYTVKPIDLANSITKRVIFSEIARIFDPLGLLNPIIVHAKLIMQELWHLQLDWDESVPNTVYTKWKEFVSQLPVVNQMSFDRKSILSGSREIQLHGFCDASEKAYGACIYLRSIDKNGKIQVSLYCAKSRVAPIRQVQTIPRLELCAAQLLVHLYTNVKSAISIPIDKTVFWSDSSIALHWLNTSPHVLKTFVANRVADIQSKTRHEDWMHVRSKDNPADALSRGQLPGIFIENQLWTCGPAWLAGGEEHWPKFNLQLPQSIPELRNVICFLSMTDDTLLYKYPKFSELQRTVAYCLRFKYRQTGPLTVKELQRATSRIIRWVQLTAFAQDLKELHKNKCVHQKSCLASLDPGIDEEGIIRVGGRLQNSAISYNQKHPIVLPKDHYITRLLINSAHLSGLHSGIQATLYTLRQHYWVVDGRNQVRQVIHKCLRCARLKPLPVDYKMGNLPAVRVSEARPFLNTGVDYCGPFFIKEKKLRNQNRVKAYVAVFICLATKAIHIEVVGDLTTEAFLAALRRFISRRGLCASMYSDNGTNFVGANNELKEIHTLLQSEDHNKKVQRHLAEKNISWNFNPPYAPHFGGIWEAAVKSFKYHLIRVMGNELFTFEQLTTLSTEIEAILNSRPLTPLSSDPNDILALTPAHFLIGNSLTSLPEQDFSDIPSNRLSAWQHLQKLKQDFWARWHKEYLSELNVRSKWSKGDHSIDEGSIVLLRDDHLPPLQWRMGRVIRTHTGPDGIIRVVTVKTANGEVERAVKKLAPLPIDSDKH